MTDQSAKLKIDYRARPIPMSCRCAVCRATIDEWNYALIVTISKEGMKDKKIVIHDNDGVCLEILKVGLKLAKPSFKSSRLPITQGDSQ